MQDSVDSKVKLGVKNSPEIVRLLEAYEQGGLGDVTEEDYDTQSDGHSDSGDSDANAESD
jgi:hypothetical protein